jgi:hypothetical protein
MAARHKTATDTVAVFAIAIMTPLPQVR